MRDRRRSNGHRGGHHRGDEQFGSAHLSPPLAERSVPRFGTDRRPVFGEVNGAEENIEVSPDVRQAILEHANQPAHHVSGDRRVEVGQRSQAGLPGSAADPGDRLASLDCPLDTGRRLHPSARSGRRRRQQQSPVDSSAPTMIVRAIHSAPRPVIDDPRSSRMRALAGCSTTGSNFEQKSHTTVTKRVLLRA